MILLDDKIPPAVIGTIVKIFGVAYTHPKIDGLFFQISAPEPTTPYQNKEEKLQIRLSDINKFCKNPLEKLGEFLVDFMEVKEYSNIDIDKNKVKVKLAEYSLEYVRGGRIIMKYTSISTASLKNNVIKFDLKSVDDEIQRTLANVDKDPLAAAHNAACTLESALKAYLDNKKIDYKNNDVLLDLWKKFVESMNISPKNLENKQYKEIASGLFKIVQATAEIRNSKSSAHGQSEVQRKQNSISVRHARLVINSVHTLSNYIIECI